MEMRVNIFFHLKLLRFIQMSDINMELLLLL